VSGVWVVSYVALWVAVIVLGVAVVVLLREVGVLHSRLAPMGANPAGQGPAVGEPAPLASPAGYGAPMTLVAFTSPSCTACEVLRPALATVTRQYREVAVVEVSLGPETTPVFRAFNVADTPYVVAVDGEGIARGTGVVNTLEQVEELLALAGHGAGTA
jgi:hypothetical protein